MTARKPKKTHSSAERRTARSMNYWYARISGDDMTRYWNALRVFAKDAKWPITSGFWASGITGKGDFLVGATVSTTRNGFVLRFTERGTCK
jgi:hypothetical protein